MEHAGMSDDDLDNLRDLAKRQSANHAEKKILAAVAEIERLRQQVTQRGARMQIMREWMLPNDWRHFVITRPEAGEWFDDDGVPR